ncbi:hypothetical protein, partial [Aerolutibacter daejeonensis]|uniref:hypothetical protein n=1 Tax=Aerolutibacter daejeonensis TaxID=346181 RepID=UPI001E31E6C5
MAAESAAQAASKWKRMADLGTEGTALFAAARVMRQAWNAYCWFDARVAGRQQSRDYPFPNAMCM